MRKSAPVKTKKLAPIIKEPVPDSTFLNKLIKRIGTTKAYHFIAERAGYERYPVTIEQFIDDPNYLGGIVQLFPKWRELLIELYPHPLHSAYDQVILTGAIGQGKTWACIVAMLYDIYRFLCLKDPHRQFTIGKTKYLLFVVFNTTLKASESNALNDIFSIMKLSPFFIAENAKVKNRVMRKRWDLPHKIRIVNASRANHIRGHEVVGGLLDELNFQENRKDQAIGNYTEMKSRISSRFKLGEHYELPARFFVATSRKDETGYAEILVKQGAKEPGTKICAYSQWEVLGPAGKKDYEYLRFKNPKKPTGYDEELAYEHGAMFKIFVGDSSQDPFIITDEDELKKLPRDLVINVPKEHRDEFEKDIITNLRDLAGIATWSTFRFVFNPRFITDSCSLPKSKNGLPMGMKKLIIDLQFEDDTDTVLDYLDITKCLSKDAVYYVHMDYAATVARCAIAFTRNMGLVDISDAATYGEHVNRACYYQTDLLLYIVRRPGKEVPLDKLESFLKDLKRMGYRIGKFTADQYQSKHTLQSLGKQYFPTEHWSVDKPRDSYDLWKQLMLNRCQVDGETIPRWRGPNHPLLIKEFSELVDLGVKIDHPDPKTTGTNDMPSKDGTDAVVGSLYQCYHNSTIIKTISAAHKAAFDKKRKEPKILTDRERIREEIMKKIKNQTRGIMT